MSRLEHEIGELKSRNEELHNKLTEHTHTTDLMADKEVTTLKERLKNERHAFDAKTKKMADQIEELRSEVGTRRNRGRYRTDFSGFYSCFNNKWSNGFPKLNCKLTPK